MGDLGSIIAESIPGGGIIGNVWDAINPFADGGLVARPTLGLVGEAGPELILPLTRPLRTMELVERTGLEDVVLSRAVRRGWSPSGAGLSAAPLSSGRVEAGPTHVQHGDTNYHVTVTTAATDPDIVAHRIQRRLAMAAGM